MYSVTYIELPYHHYDATMGTPYQPINLSAIQLINELRLTKHAPHSLLSVSSSQKSLKGDLLGKVRPVSHLHCDATRTVLGPLDRHVHDQVLVSSLFSGRQSQAIDVQKARIDKVAPGLLHVDFSLV